MAGFGSTQRGQVLSEPDLTHSVGPFWESLSKTVGWCLPKVDLGNPATCLRSPSSRPRLFTTGHLNTTAEALRSRYPETPAAIGSLHDGRLVVCWPDLDLSDGAAEAASGGYFDVNNTPPWDTWVAFVHYPDDSEQSYLVAWVPAGFVRLADAGIRVIPRNASSGSRILMSTSSISSSASP
jgi:hypothetical protein